MAAVFVLGAAASAGYFAFSTRPGPATVQAGPPPAQTLPPIIVQLVQPAATGAVPVAGVAANGVEGAGMAVTPAGMAEVTEPESWVLVGPPEPVTLLKQVEIGAAPQALTQGADQVPASTSVKPSRSEKVEAKPTKEGVPVAAGGVKIDVNTASQAQLESLPLVGPSMAKRIIEYRAAHGPFKSVKDLDKVKGIGEKTLAKLMPLVTVGDAAGTGTR